MRVYCNYKLIPHAYWLRSENGFYAYAYNVINVTLNV